MAPVSALWLKLQLIISNCLVIVQLSQLDLGVLEQVFDAGFESQEGKEQLEAVETHKNDGPLHLYYSYQRLLQTHSNDYYNLVPKTVISSRQRLL